MAPTVGRDHVYVYIYIFFLDVDFIWFKRRNYTLQTGPGMSHWTSPKLNQTMCFHAALFFPEIEHAPLQPHTSQNRLNTKIILVFSVFLVLFAVRMPISFLWQKKGRVLVKVGWISSSAICSTKNMSSGLLWNLAPGQTALSCLRYGGWWGAVNIAVLKTVAGNSSLSFLNIFQ